MLMIMVTNETPSVKGHFMQKSIASTTKSQSYKMSNRNAHCYGEIFVYPLSILKLGRTALS